MKSPVESYLKKEKPKLNSLFLKFFCYLISSGLMRRDTGGLAKGTFFFETKA